MKQQEQRRMIILSDIGLQCPFASFQQIDFEHKPRCVSSDCLEQTLNENEHFWTNVISFASVLALQQNFLKLCQSTSLNLSDSFSRYTKRNANLIKRYFFRRF